MSQWWIMSCRYCIVAHTCCIWRDDQTAIRRQQPLHSNEGNNLCVFVCLLFAPSVIWTASEHIDTRHMLHDTNIVTLTYWHIDTRALTFHNCMILLRHSCCTILLTKYFLFSKPLIKYLRVLCYIWISSENTDRWCGHNNENNHDDVKRSDLWPDDRNIIDDDDVASFLVTDVPTQLPKHLCLWQ